MLKTLALVAVVLQSLAFLTSRPVAREPTSISHWICCRCRWSHSKHRLPWLRQPGRDSGIRRRRIRWLRVAQKSEAELWPPNLPAEESNAINAAVGARDCCFG